MDCYMQQTATAADFWQQLILSSICGSHWVPALVLHQLVAPSEITTEKIHLLGIFRFCFR